MIFRFFSLYSALPQQCASQPVISVQAWTCWGGEGRLPCRTRWNCFCMDSSVDVGSSGMMAATWCFCVFLQQNNIDDFKIVRYLSTRNSRIRSRAVDAAVNVWWEITLCRIVGCKTVLEAYWNSCSFGCSSKPVSNTVGASSKWVVLTGRETSLIWLVITSTVWSRNGFSVFSFVFM